jgi:regulator of protease activity HflC (stomatin/prohibitin superfamily)
MIGAEIFQLAADFLKGAWDYTWPFRIIDEWEEAIILRLGKYHRSRKKGWAWKWPLIEQVWEQSIAMTTVPSGSQSLVTKDNQNIVISGIIKYRVSDVKVYLTEVTEAVDALKDMTQGIIKNVIMQRTWEECRDSDLDQKITTRVKTEAKRWGIEVDKVTLGSIGILKSFRLIR